MMYLNSMALNSKIEKSRAEFNCLLSLAEACYARSHYAKSASYLQLAAGFAWANHPGFFRSDRLEALLQNLARTIGGDFFRPAPPTNLGSKQKVLHVLTQAYGIGGHTRLVWRWMQLDVNSEHHFVITQQCGRTIPVELVAASKGSGGNGYVLDKHRKSLIEIAVKLREIGSKFDFIVSHTHPYDVTPWLAWAGRLQRPPITLLNHADHVFWIGGSSTDIVANIRETALQLSVERRGIERARNIILPIPLKQSSGTSRCEARRQLGIELNRPVAISIASAYKFAQIGMGSFAELHNQLLVRNPDLLILLIGPSPEVAYWKKWSEFTGGRLRPLGLQAEVDKYLACANVYLDSTPLSSLTSLLEAALSGLPCVSWRPFAADGNIEILSVDDPALSPHSMFYSDEEAYFCRIEELLSSPGLAKHVGETLRQTVIRYHLSDVWRDQLKLTYEKANEKFQFYADVVRPPAPFSCLLQEYDLALSYLGGGEKLVLPPMNSLLPIDVRLRALKSVGAGKKEMVRELLPGFVINSLRWTKAWAKSLGKTMER